ncbi:MAG: molybdenum cofactor guanylyltransferase [Herpetosiphonaceae bacterium]|nr:molybdenum cofactor guanylyltransferase [Herpetosiphonaceae bacterium]
MGEPISGVVLAGGKSLRLGQDKRRLRLWGEAGPTLLEHTVAVLHTVCDEVIVVLNDPLEWTNLAVRIVPDAFPSGGSLGGIATGLMAAQHSAALVVAADMPLLNVALLRWMVDQQRTYDILAPQTTGDTKSGGWETLCAIYMRSCLPVMTALLAEGNLKIRRVYDQVRVQAVTEDQLRRFDPAGVAFGNINTLADWQQMQHQLAIAGTTHAE